MQSDQDKIISEEQLEHGWPRICGASDCILRGFKGASHPNALGAIAADLAPVTWVLLDDILELDRGDLPSNFDKLVGWILQEGCN